MFLILTCSGFLPNQLVTRKALPYGGKNNILHPLVVLRHEINGTRLELNPLLLQKPLLDDLPCSPRELNREVVHLSLVELHVLDQTLRSSDALPEDAYLLGDELDELRLGRARVALDVLGNVEYGVRLGRVDAVGARDVLRDGREEPQAGRLLENRLGRVVLLKDSHQSQLDKNSHKIVRVESVGAKTGTMDTKMVDFSFPSIL